ncbi:fatty-acid amide hydrolase 1-like [Babylonia areolata]|uniref:fatty-acid amide hydrolase 1-like n=1 Tax=Babylonia areolata TaxID=304850 RepID=UPI003FCF38B8
MWMHMHGHGHQLVGRVYDYLENIQPGLARKVFGGVVTTSAVFYLAVRGCRYYRSWQVGKERGQSARDACQTLRDYLAEKEQEEGPVNREKEAMIVSLDAKQLKEKLWRGELKVLEVLRAYQRKALEVNDELNCITEPIFEAEAMAVDLDLLKPNQRGPLHGVPVSLKDTLNVEGYDNHAGFAVLVDKPAEKDADIVQLLKGLGAVPFVRTNFPQGLMTFACSNPMYGRTGNPHDTSRTPGGSSGGEGALLGGGGSVIGIGSDIGGSIRIPCQFCGVYGLKPTVDRIGNKGHTPLASGQMLVRFCMGPMARDMDSLIVLSQELFTPRMHRLDPAVAPLPFRDEVLEETGPLRIGFYTAIEGSSSHPACVRAVMEAKAALERKGHKVVQFTPPRAFDTFCELYMRACFGDGDEENQRMLKDDVLDVCVRFSHYLQKLPLYLRRILSKVIGVMDPPLGRMGNAVCRLPRRIIDWWHLQDQIQAYKQEFLDAWRNQKLDAVICPGLPYPAVTAGFEDHVLSGAVYTTLYNLVNYPVGILPVTTITQQDIQRVKDPSVYPRSGAFEKFIVKDSEGSEGMPVAVQCVALPFQEEVVLRVMKEIDSTIRQ